MKQILSLALIFSCLNAVGQNVTYQRLKAHKIKDYVILRIEDVRGKKQITREIETRDGTIKSHPLKNGELYLSSTESSFNIIFDFLNPLLYKVEIKEQTASDPIYGNINSFFDQLSNLVQSTQNLTAPPLKWDSAKSIVKRIDKSKAIDVTDLTKYKTDDILDWKMWEYQYSKDPEKFFEKESMEKIYSSVSDIDDFLNNGEFEKKMKKIVEDLQNAKTLSDFRRLVTTSKKDIQKVSVSNESQSNDITSASGAVENFHWNLKEVKLNPANIKQQDVTTYNTKNRTTYTLEAFTQLVKDSIYRIVRGKVFKTYTERKLNNYFASAKNIMKQRESIVNRVGELLALLESYLQTRVYTCRSSCEYIKGGVVEFDDDEIIDVTVSITALSFDFDNYRQEPTKEVYKAVLKVSNYASVIPEFALGVIYSEISFPKYGTVTSGGNQVVASAGNDNLKLVPSAMLNLVLNQGYGPAYPMVQLGVGSGKVYPTIMAGAGTRIFSYKNHNLRNVSLAAGLVWHWNQELTNLKIGDVVTGTADINKDLSYVMQSIPTFYIGVHFNF